MPSETTAAPARDEPGRRWPPPGFPARVVTVVLLVALAAVSMLPFAWQLGSSLKDLTEIIAYPPRFLPSQWRWENYAEVWNSVPFARFTLNTLIVATLATLGQTLSAAAVAYGFARFRFRGRNVAFMLCLTSLMLPWEVTIVPQFLLFRELGWLDTLLPLIVPHWFAVGATGAFSIFLLRQFFMTIPLDLDEAAKLDGASYPRIFVTILLPLARPALITVAILAFLVHWGEFIQPFVYLNSTENFVLSLGIRFFQTLPSTEPSRDHLLMAASVLITLPPIIIFFVLQRYFVKGVATTGLKG